MAAGLFLLGAIAGCAWDTVAGFPARGTPLTPLSVYRKWWAETEACSGRTGDFDSVSWFTVPQGDPLQNNSDGEWFPSGNRIVLTQTSFAIGELVRHEMLHALVRGHGHPRSEFLEKCGGVVVCNDQCIRDAGPPPRPPANALHVPPSALEIHVAVSSLTPSSAVDGGFFSMTVTAKNLAPNPVVVDLSTILVGALPPSFGFSAVQPGNSFQYTTSVYDAEVTHFASGETKQFVFDFMNRPGDYRESLPPGRWTLYGAYGGVWSPDSVTIVVGP